MKNLFFIVLLSLSNAIFASGWVSGNVGYNMDVHSASVIERPDHSVWAVAVTENFVVNSTTYNGICFQLSTSADLTDLAKSVLANLMSANATGAKITFSFDASAAFDINTFLPGIPDNSLKVIRSGWLANVSVP
jgi:hypothetical protein